MLNSKNDNGSKQGVTVSRKGYDINYNTNTKKHGEVVTCGLCKGTGLDHTNSLFGVKCSACNGVGKVRV